MGCCCCCCMFVANDSRWSVLVDICWWWFVWCSAALVEAFRLIAVKLPDDEAEVPGITFVGEWSRVELVDGIDMLILLAIIIAELRFLTWGPAAPPTMAIACVPVFELEAMALSKSNVVCVVWIVAEEGAL